MRRQKATGFYKFLLAICFLCCILVTTNHAVYDSFNPDIERNAGININGYLIKPDLPLYIIILIIFVGTYFPAVTGIALLLVRRRWRRALKVCHLVASMFGFLAVASLAFLDSLTIGDIASVQCRYTPSYTCHCGTPEQPYFTAVSVCNMFAVRLLYLVLVGLGCVSTVVCFVLITCWSNRKPRAKDNQVSQMQDVPPEPTKPYPFRPSSQLSFTVYITKQHDLMLV